MDFEWTLGVRRAKRTGSALDASWKFLLPALLVPPCPVLKFVSKQPQVHQWSKLESWALAKTSSVVWLEFEMQLGAPHALDQRVPAKYDAVGGSICGLDWSDHGALATDPFIMIISRTSQRYCTGVLDYENTCKPCPWSLVALELASGPLPPRGTNRNLWSATGLPSQPSDCFAGEP